jgi:hypothetical protein
VDPDAEVKSMKREFLLLGTAIVLVGGVVLWAAEAPWEATAIAGGLALVLLLAAVLLIRPSPVVLLVGDRPEGLLDDLHRSLQRDGFDVEVCAGPENSACPVRVGRPCPAHGGPVAAVVVRNPDQTDALAPCGEAFRIPELAVETESNRAPEFAGRYARVGIDRGPEAVSETLDQLLASA